MSIGFRFGDAAVQMDREARAGLVEPGSPTHREIHVTGQGMTDDLVAEGLDDFLPLWPLGWP